MSRTNDLYQDELESAGIEIKRLEAENKRYRAALEEIVETGWGCACGRSEWCDSCNPTSALNECRKKAQAALKDK